MTKTVIVLLSYMVLLFNTTNAQENTFKIHGTIKGLDSEKMMAIITDPNDPNGYRRENVEVKNESFEFTSEVSELTHITISTGVDRVVKWAGRGYIPAKSSLLALFVYPGANVSIKGEISDFVNAYPSGDDVNDGLAKLNKAIFPVMNEAVNYSVEASKLKDDIKLEAEKKANKMSAKSIAMKEQFIADHPNLLASVWMLSDMALRSHLPMKRIDELFNSFSSKYSETSYYKELSERVNGYNSTQIGSQVKFKTDKTINGESFDIKDLRGKYVILDFWGTWCGACVKGMPGLMDFRNANKNEVEVVAVNCGDTQERWLKSKYTKDYNWIHVKSNKSDNNLVTRFNVQGYPTKIVVDPNGKIVKRHVGEDPEFYEELNKLIGVKENTAKVEDFKITATIEGLSSDEGSYYFSEKDKPEGRWIKFPMQGNKVEYTGKVSEPTIIYLNFTDNKVRKYSNPLKTGYFMSTVSLLGFVAIPNKEIKAKGKATDFIEAYAYGDRENDLMAELNQKVHPLLNKAMNLACQLGDPSLDENEKAKVGKEREELNNEIATTKFAFVKENISSIIGLYTARELLNNKISLDKASAYFSKISEDYKSSMYYNQLMDRYKQLKIEKDNIEKTSEGKSAPEIVTSETYSGKEFSLKSLRGKYVLIDFWGTWCGACIKGMPEMKVFKEKHADKLELLGIASENGSTERWRSMIKNRNFNWHQILSGKGEKNFVKKFGVSAFPTKILVSPEGQIVFRYIGEDAEFYKKLETFLK
ncbi:TlpA family protein disulfide reductase [Ancylomarina euxinus]|nr:TlpA disulfide reductase family protein [Ancylomarina euxinus]MCZ4695568.1 TlpA disulfide reductase family protein [Ancylomarina euxinus]